jgi:hypothetical protein
MAEYRVALTAGESIYELVQRFRDTLMNNPAAKVETPVGIECGHCGERVAVGESPHQ